MRDLSKPFRLAVFSVLNGNTGGIPIYDEKRLVSATDNTFILLSTQQQTQQQTQEEVNDCTWVSRLSIDIEVYNKTGSEVSKDTIDDVSNTILGLLLPTVGVSPISSGGIQFTYAFAESIISRNIGITETESVLQKVIRFVATGVQQS